MNTTFTPELNSKPNSQGKHSVMIRIIQNIDNIYKK